MLCGFICGTLLCSLWFEIKRAALFLCYRLLGKTEDAIKSLTMAVDILRITHGTNTPFMKDLLMKLEEAHAEASYKLAPKDELHEQTGYLSL